MGSGKALTVTCAVCGCRIYREDGCTGRFRRMLLRLPVGFAAGRVCLGVCQIVVPDGVWACKKHFDAGLGYPCVGKGLGWYKKVLDWQWPRWRQRRARWALQLACVRYFLARCRRREGALSDGEYRTLFRRAGLRRPSVDKLLATIKVEGAL